MAWRKRVAGPQGLAIPGNAARLRLDQPVQQAHQQALAGPVGTHHHRDAMAGQDKVKPVDQPCPAGTEGKAGYGERQLAS